MSRSHLGIASLLVALPLIVVAWTRPGRIGVDRYVELKRSGCCVAVHLDRPPVDCERAWEFALRKSRHRGRYRHEIEQCPAADMRRSFPEATHAVDLLSNVLVSPRVEERQRAARWFRQSVPHWPLIAQRDLTTVALAAGDAQVVSAGITYGRIEPGMEIPESSRPVAVSMLSSSDRFRRIAACRHLQRLHVSAEPEAVAVATLLTSHYTRACAVEALTSAVQPGKLDAVLDSYVVAEDIDTQIAAWTVLLYSPASGVTALKALADLASDDRWNVRNAAVLAIRGHADQARAVMKQLAAGPRRATIERVLERGSYLRY